MINATVRIYPNTPRHLTIMDAKFAPPVSRSLELAYCTEDKGSTDGGLKVIYFNTNQNNKINPTRCNNNLNIEYHQDDQRLHLNMGMCRRHPPPCLGRQEHKIAAKDDSSLFILNTVTVPSPDHLGKLYLTQCLYNKC